MGGWMPIDDNTPRDTVIDVYVWGVDVAGFDDGFRWCDVRLIDERTLAVWRETDPEDGDGYWRLTFRGNKLAGKTWQTDWEAIDTPAAG